ncbi:MAG: AMP-binding protein [Candidatus Hydrogenedentes bacterium]|nr:AMP-binding protein [Candidatus Hydrogenedentota bacterium]
MEWVDADLPVPECSYVELLESSLRAFGGRPAAHFLGVTQSFADIEALSARFASFLVDAGCGPGDIVAVNLPNSLQFIIAQMGALRAGCIASGLSFLLSPREMGQQLKDCGARVLVTLDRTFEQKFMRIRDEMPGLTHVVVTNIADFLPGYKRVLGRLAGRIPTGRIVPVPGKDIVPFMRIMADWPARAPKVERSPEDTCLIQYTGGTTGVPKGAELTHGNLVASIGQIAQWLKQGRGRHVYCCAFPYFHIAGAAMSMHALSTGNAQIVIPDPRDTRYICREMRRYSPTSMFNVPSLYHMLLREPAFHALAFSSFEGCLAAAAPFAAETYRELETATRGAQVGSGYGLTEAAGFLTLDLYGGRKKIGASGVPVQNTRIKLVDLDTGTQEVPQGQEGQIIARGPQVMKGYYRNAEETALALREFEGERWLYTGDVGRMDEDGYLFVVDRVKDMVNVGGYKVFSRLVEDVLNEHPAVQRCAVLGVPNPDRPGSELVKAAVELTPAYGDRPGRGLSGELVKHCRENLAAYEVPTVFEFVTELPLTAVGKVDKKAIR